MDDGCGTTDKWKRKRKDATGTLLMIGGDEKNRTERKSLHSSDCPGLLALILNPEPEAIKKYM